MINLKVTPEEFIAFYNESCDTSFEFKDQCMYENKGGIYLHEPGGGNGSIICRREYTPSDSIEYKKWEMIQTLLSHSWDMSVKRRKEQQI